MAMPGASAVAIAKARVFATASDGAGKVFERGKDGFHATGEFRAGPGASKIFAPTWPQPQLAVLRADKRVLSRVALLELPNPSFFAAVDDFDGDGKPDVAVVTYSGAIADPSRDGLVLFSGGRGPGHGYPAGPAPISIATGDVDGDGKADLAVATGDEVIVFLTR